MKTGIFLVLIAVLLPAWPIYLWADDLRIGATLSLTGAYANFGRLGLEGIQLAVEEVNSKGGVRGRQVKLVAEDFGTYDLKRAVSATHKLIKVDKVEIFLPFIVEDSEVIVPITTRVPLLTMATGCGARKCSSNLGPYHVRAPSSHDAIVERLVQYAVSQKVKRTCIVAAEATYFEGYGRYIEELSKKAGQEVTYVSVPLSNTEDYREVATRFAHNNCDAIYAWLAVGSAGGFFRRVRENGSRALLLSIVETDDPQILKTAGAAAEGVVFAAFSQGSVEFQERFRKRFGELPMRPAVPAYDGVKLLLELAGKVGTAPGALREALLKVKDHPAENGVITYTAEGERLGAAVKLMRISGGKTVEMP